MPQSVYRRHEKPRQRGVTLIELMVTIGIAVILMGIAVPSLSSFVLRGRISANVSDLVGAINLARSEAVKMGAGVTICRSTDQATCATNSSGWGAGWIVFSDPNYNATVDTGETLIRAFPALSNGATATGNSGIPDALTFAGTGRPNATFAGALVTICPSTSAPGTSTSYCRYVCINAQGRPRVDTPEQYATDTICGN